MMGKRFHTFYRSSGLLLCLLLVALSSTAQDETTPQHGDVNSDNEVNIADVNTIIDLILDGASSSATADVNHDGEINIADLNMVIGIILDEQATHLKTYTVGEVSFTMVEVDGGTFMSRHSPQVTLSPFAIGRTEVTQALWVAVMGSNPSYHDGVSRPGGPDYPVEMVSWDDCQEFIAKLNEMTGRTFRLPSEAEWEFAARGGNYSHGYMYAGSDDKDEVAWHRNNSGHTTHPVAELIPNELGLYDMCGNVDEFCLDGYSGDYYCNNPLTNPIMQSTDGEHVSCGGHYMTIAVSIGRYGSSSTAIPAKGLRLAMGEPVYDTTLSLSKYEVETNDGLCDEVTIAGGSGLYQVDCNNDEALTITHQDTIVRLDAIDVGQATITVSDLTTGEQATIAVTVNPSEFVMEHFTVGKETFAMIKVDGGTFMMGATPEQEDDATDDERPAHEVTVSSFFIGQTEVTVGMWRAVLGYNPIPYYIPEYSPPSNAAVSCVSWDDCQNFIAKLNEMTGRTFRLPTEAEWEFAARGGNRGHGYKYAGSDILDEVAVFTGYRYPLVRTKFPNELGLYNMSGSVLEWCQDWFGPYGNEPLVNPVGSESGTVRVIRGGSYYWKESTYCRVSWRMGSDPAPENYIDNYPIGLRLVMEDTSNSQ